MMFRLSVLVGVACATQDHWLKDIEVGDEGLSLMQLRAHRQTDAALDDDAHEQMEHHATHSGCFNPKEWYDTTAKHWVNNLGGNGLLNGEPITSQGNQDRVLDSLFSQEHLDKTNRFYVEFGFNQDGWDETGRNLADKANPSYNTGSGPNTQYLHSHGWNGLLMDGSHENVSMNLRKEFITRENVGSLFNKYGVPKEVDYVSVDIDSCDLWVFLGILEGGFRPRVFTVEYNAFFPLEKSVTNVCKNADGELYTYNGDNMHGASLAALHKAANLRGYSIVYVTTLLDAFMVRKDLLCPGALLPIETFSAATGLAGKRPASPEEIAEWMQEY